MTVEEKYTDKQCNCNDEYRVSLCPIHDKDIDLNNDIITDTDILNKGQLMHSNAAFGFLCKKCNSTVLHFFKHCAECGQPLKIMSRIVTEAINKAIQMQRNQGK